MQESNFTVRVEQDLKMAFSEAAHRQDRTGAQLVRDFMRQVVQDAREKEEYEEWFKAKVEAGLQAVRDGRTLPHEEVKKRQAARRELLLQGIDRQAQ